MMVDSSALIAILKDEPERPPFRDLLLETPRPQICAVSVVETSMVAGPGRQADVDALLNAARLEVVAFDQAHARLAIEAHRTYGQGSGSPARLNFGDCMVYAVAKAAGHRLLFKGADFTHTDLEPAIR